MDLYDLVGDTVWCSGDAGPMRIRGFDLVNSRCSIQNNGYLELYPPADFASRSTMDGRLGAFPYAADAVRGSSMYMLQMTVRNVPAPAATAILVKERGQATLVDVDGVNACPFGLQILSGSQVSMSLATPNTVTGATNQVSLAGAATTFAACAAGLDSATQFCRTDGV